VGDLVYAVPDVRSRAEEGVLVSEVVTPAQVERRLVQLSKDLDDAQTWLQQAEEAYADGKSAYEIGIAQARMTVAARYAERGVKATVQEKEDEALLTCSDLLTTMNLSDATVRSARSNVQRVRTQVDITRSLAASVRSSLEM
jgi:hypothetical protein